MMIKKAVFSYFQDTDVSEVYKVHSFLIDQDDGPYILRVLEGEESAGERRYCAQTRTDKDGADWTRGTPAGTVQRAIANLGVLGCTSVIKDKL